MLRRIILYLSGSLLRIVVFFGVSIVCFSLLATNPKHIKSLVYETGIYTNFTAAVLDDSVASQTDSTLPVENPDIKDIIKKSFPPQSLQKNSEHVIDGIYLWLDGTTPKPTFKADFTKERQQASDDIAKYAFNRLSSLPTCFAVPETFDPFTAGCQPPFTDVVAEQQGLSATIAGEEGILPKATFSTDDLPSDMDNKTLYQRYDYAPTIYKWLKLSPIIVIMLFLISGAGIVLLSHTRRIGFQRLGITIVASGGALLFTPILFSFVLPNLTKSMQFTAKDSSKAQHLLDQVITAISNDFYVLLINVSLQLVLLGTLILLAEKFTRPNSKYRGLQKRAGLISGYAKKPSSSKKHAYKPASIPVQSSEESKRHRPKRTKNKKYRKIPKKEI